MYLEIRGYYFGQKEVAGIGHIHQEQGIAGDGSTCTAAVFLLDNAAEAVNGELAASHFEQGADDGTHHVAQESVGLDGEHPGYIVHTSPGGVHDAAVVGFHVGMQFAEAGEVGVVEQGLGGLVHPFEVRCLKEAAAVLAVEGHLGGGDVVAVRACRGVEAGMGIRFHGTKAVHGDVGRQQAVQFVGDEGGVKGRVAVEVSHHEAGMDAGIGATGTHYLHLAAQQGGKGTHEALLHTGTVGLNLPAVIGGAIVS